MFWKINDEWSNLCISIEPSFNTYISPDLLHKLYETDDYYMKIMAVA